VLCSSSSSSSTENKNKKFPLTQKLLPQSSSSSTPRPQSSSNTPPPQAQSSSQPQTESNNQQQYSSYNQNQQNQQYYQQFNPFQQFPPFDQFQNQHIDDMQVFLGYILDNLNQQQNQYHSSNTFGFFDTMNNLFNMASNFAEQIPQFQQNQSFQGQPPASKLAMESLKIVSEKSRLVKLQPTCSICMEDFKDTPDQRIRAMPCGHVYHEECIFAWLEKSNTCCNCRYEIETDNREYNIAMKKRMANLHPVFTEHECALAPQGACDYEDENGVYYEDVEEHEASHIIQSSCGCHFHDSCLRSSLLVHGYIIKDEGGEVNFRCIKCHKNATATFPPIDKICNNKNEKKELNDSKGKKSEEIVPESSRSRPSNEENKLFEPTNASAENIIKNQSNVSEEEGVIVDQLIKENKSSELNENDVCNKSRIDITQQKCALISQDACDFEGHDGMLYGNDDEPKPMIQSSCGCCFHNSCLKSSLVIRGYNIDKNENSSIEFKCPKCNKNAKVTLL